MNTHLKLGGPVREIPLDARGEAVTQPAARPARTTATRKALDRAIEFINVELAAAGRTERAGLHEVGPRQFSVLLGDATRSTVRNARDCTVYAEGVWMGMRALRDAGVREERGREDTAGVH